MEQFETEEQQVEAIKRFWKENGTALIVGAVLGLGGLYGWRYYNDSQIENKEQASIAFEKASTELLDSEQGFSQAKTYIDTHSDTGYSLLMALELAKKAIDSKDLPEAAKQLEFVAANTQVSAVKSVAQVRLARVQLEQGDLDAALATAEKIEDEAFSGASHEIKGDVYQAQELFDKARAAYSAALEGNERNPVLKMKLDNLAILANG
ncbi:tetratricopeptide repeat protein [Paraglaciecola aquimarina]|uniref:Ancillary SecYEG translocon subunit n=1 Tax=Paraglaciecola aquimarina TaxID=1235557 RepID=A0ABU3SWN4_9ALTE|nr:tetratricopeptide repeat protein [Paraglaciecola aquimarina]MDU0354414.1 tetratricopeptide repeat protein [Paraglaciecola aquimarina]